VTARELSGRELAARVRAETARRAAELAAAGRPPRLAVVTATDDEASAAYVRSIASAAAKAGIACDVLRTATAEGVAAILAQLADDPKVHGIVLQTVPHRDSRRWSWLSGGPGRSWSAWSPVMVR
jgi:methylenetetrahydrofolate dehydrogenase (NADP+)/methenyltetrahydrofolate cyclohydrolase